MGSESFCQPSGVSQALFRVFGVNHESMATKLACDLQGFLRGVTLTKRDVGSSIGQKDEDRGRRDIALGETEGVCQGVRPPVGRYSSAVKASARLSVGSRRTCADVPRKTIMATSSPLLNERVSIPEVAPFSERHLPSRTPFPRRSPSPGVKLILSTDGVLARHRTTWHESQSRFFRVGGNNGGNS
jgi:YD repeat-containing protein